jgi:hypothetical protein
VAIISPSLHIYGKPPFIRVDSIDFQLLFSHNVARMVFVDFFYTTEGILLLRVTPVT